MITVYTFKNAAAIIICPHCGQKEKIAIACLERKSNHLELTCSCKSTYRVTLEFRENFRKEVNIPGHYNASRVDSPGESGSLLIKNISACGLGITFPESHLFREDHTLTVAFKLDGSESTITKTVAVRFVHDKYCGCEFIEKQLYRDEIKLFLER